ncbi:MAG: hypothetical protein V7L00_29420 [Nostoc sp.]|uniref:hypothetical protein n=1 Tax=Nostoc sp. TaxID=1180 RepID=UPI002FF87E4A
MEKSRQGSWSQADELVPILLGEDPQAIGDCVGSLPRIISVASSAWALFMALATFLNTMPINRKHSWAFSLGGSYGSHWARRSAKGNRKSIVFSRAC